MGSGMIRNLAGAGHEVRLYARTPSRARGLPATLVDGFKPDSQVALGLSLLALVASEAIEGFLLMKCLRILVWQAAALVLIDISLSFFVVIPTFDALGCARIPALGG